MLVMVVIATIVYTCMRTVARFSQQLLFALTISRSTSQQTDAEKARNHIAWSGAEDNITPTEADVLVIFDCCEAGGLGGLKVRHSRPSFEFIAACGKKERTPRPGERSFTSGLMWALKELREDYPFSAITLVEKIKKYPLLLETQSPELLRRNEFADGLVWISPLNVVGPKPEAAVQSVKRDPRHEYIDLRFNFYRRVKTEDAKNLAKHLSPLVSSEESFGAKHITLLDISSTFSKAVAGFQSSSMASKRKSLTPTPQIMQYSHEEDSEGKLRFQWQRRLSNN